MFHLYFCTFSGSVLGIVYITKPKEHRKVLPLPGVFHNPVGNGSYMNGSAAQWSAKRSAPQLIVLIAGNQSELIGIGSSLTGTFDLGLQTYSWFQASILFMDKVGFVSFNIPESGEMKQSFGTKALSRPVAGTRAFIPSSECHGEAHLWGKIWSFFVGFLRIRSVIRVKACRASSPPPSLVFAKTNIHRYNYIHCFTSEV